jgi:hypothetical protein
MTSPGKPQSTAEPAPPGGLQLLVSAPLSLPPAGSTAIVVERGMPVLDQDLQEVGHVAGVVVDPARQTATHLVVVRWQSALDYRVLPIDRVARVGADGVRLNVALPALDSLPTWSAFEAHLSRKESI